MGETKRKLIDELIVRRGLSYVDAIKELERLGEEARSPYVEAAEELRAALSRPWWAEAP